ncbi:Muc_lac_enz protein [Aspergillus sp. HF37]|nr:Muc_lac_enz protein [Aspergillus sp. HF37]
MPAPGPVPSRQSAPHPHAVVVDSTGEFILVPDLGADLVRIFHINQETGLLEQQDPLEVGPGSGPRHGAFWTHAGDSDSTSCIKFFLVSELDNALTAYDVEYPGDGTISLKQTYRGSTFGKMTVPDRAAAAEIAVTPDNNHILVSNRGDNTFGPGNDSMAVFSYMDGKVAFSG